MLEISFDKEKTCRACTKTDIELSPLFAREDPLEGVCFLNMIIECTMCTVQEDDELPHLICSECKERVRIAYDFKKQYEKSQRKLLSILQLMKQAPVEENNICNNSVEEKNQEQIQEHHSEDLPEEGNNNLRQKSTRNSSTKRVLCEKCDQTFANSDRLKEHVKAAHKSPKHSCTICFKEFVRLGHLTRHVKKVHKKEDILEEDIAIQNSLVKIEAECVVESKIEEEKSSKSDSDTEQFSFDFCGTDNEDDPTYEPKDISFKLVKDEPGDNDIKTTTDPSLAKDKEHSEKNGNQELIIKDEEQSSPNTKQSMPLDSSRRFQCDQCHKAFKRKSHLKQHLLCHTKVKPYQCTICQKKFGRPDNLKVHMSNHGQKQFQCNSCDRSFGQAYLLKRHKDQTHSEEKPFLCSICGQTFVRNGDLAVHMRRHTGEKPYKCQYCNKGFTRSTEVYVHERYHTGEKKHVCNICGKAFQRPYNLLVHVRTHTGERPYQCPHCPKNFAQCSDLKAHIRRHTGERFRCELCGMGFIHAFVLNQHKLSVHGIEVQSRIKRVAKLITDSQ